MQTHFAFGKRGLDLFLPEGFRYNLLQTRTAPQLSDAGAAVAAALDRPIGTAPLMQLAVGKKTAAIAICDITRPAPNSITLPPLLDRLRKAGIKPEHITILIATGLHRPATHEEILGIVGPRVASCYPVVSHDARVLDQHRSLGTTRRGTPVFIDGRFLDADLHITLGFIEQHLMLGFSGGRKLVAPGLAAEETIKAIHSPRFMREPLATEGSIEHNPLHAELLEIAALARHDFLLDVTLTQSRQISGVFAGHPHAAHAAGVKFINETSLQTLPQPMDAVITSAAGFPLDLTFYQSLKGVTAAQHILRPGGALLLLAACAEGTGSSEFTGKLAAFPGCQPYLDEIRSAPVVIDQWQLEKFALAARDRRVLFFVPGVARAQLGSLGPHSYGTAEEAVAALFQDLPAGADVALVPDGPYTYARVS